MSYRTDENGKYVRTVRCSNCWESGHNKSKCPAEKERYERAKLEDPDSWFVKRYEADKEARSKRACGYCRESGHTRRTCTTFLDDKQKTVKLNKEWRQQALDFFKNLGLGVGSLISVKETSSWNHRSRTAKVCLVSAIQWDTLSFKIKEGSGGHQMPTTAKYALHVRPINDFGRTIGIHFPIDSAGVVTEASSYGTFVDVLGPISPSMVEANVPGTWLAGDGAVVDNMFMDDGKPVQRCYIHWVAQ